MSDFRQDRKFKFEDGKIINRVSGEAIPADEPVFIFRARDRKALAELLHYQDIVEDEHHRAAIQESIEAFQEFKEAHPERMKEPGITRHFALKNASEK